MDADSINSSVSPSPFNNLLYQNVQPTAESRSEVSSNESEWSDINSIAQQMGVTVAELQVDRFKVDRSKLEIMVKDSSPIEGMNAAELFFETVSKTTFTRISWPCRLKIGAKTKKDPHVRIVGKPNDVKKAKERILSVLDSRGSRVTMKMDISYTDHSFIIGRGGNNIKKIMEDTATHIHFPDSNRSNPIEKSNQVSLCGSLDGVEKARHAVRLSTPLTISFELPVPGGIIPDNNIDYVKEIESKFKIQVIFSSKSKIHVLLVSVKGSERDATNVQDATRFLAIHMCGKSQIEVTLRLEISPHYHESVKGRNGKNLLNIINQTGAMIIFPDLKDANIKPIKRSQVTITGCIDSVYRARQQLIGNLPIQISFDYPENSNKGDFDQLNNKYGVSIEHRPKSRQSTLSLVVKGVEKHIDNIYEVRHMLLNLKPPCIKASIPSTYFTAKDTDPLHSMQRRNLLDSNSLYADNCSSAGLQQSFEQTLLSSSFNSQLNGSGFPQHTLELSPNMKDLHRLSTSALNRFHAIQMLQQQTNNTNLPFSSMPNMMTSPRSTGTNTSGYFSGCGSTTSMDHIYGPYNTNNQYDREQRPQPDNKAYSDMLCSAAENPHKITFNIDSQPFNPNSSLPHRNTDFDRKRVEGFKAMERYENTREQLRTPTPSWAGFGLSKTSPLALEGTKMPQWPRPSGSSLFDKIATTSLLDTISATDRSPLSRFKDIHSLLTHIKLAHYISNLVVQGIDLKSFLLLTNEDLVELGINAFGARKRMILAINQINAEAPQEYDWVQIAECKDIQSLLTQINMDHYIEEFVKNEVDIETFKMLTNNDLKQLGVQTFGERKRIVIAINQLKSGKFSGSVAVGAERRPSISW